MILPKSCNVSLSSDIIYLLGFVHFNLFHCLHRPEKDTEIFFDGTTPTFRCCSTLKVNENEKPKCVMQYQNENIFTAYFTGERELGEIGNRYFINEAVFHILCAKHRNFGFHVENIYCNLQEHSQWFKTEAK